MACRSKRMILKQENTLSEKRRLLNIKEEQVATLKEEIVDLSQLIDITQTTRSKIPVPKVTQQNVTQQNVSQVFRSTETIVATKTVEQTKMRPAKPAKPARRQTEMSRSPEKHFDAGQQYNVRRGSFMK